MFDNIIQLNEQVIKTELKDLVKQSIEETLNSLLDQEAEELRSLLMLQSISVRMTVRDIGPAITHAIYKRLPAMSR